MFLWVTSRQTDFVTPLQQGFGLRIQALRDKHGITQEKLSELSSLSRESVSRIENAQQEACLEVLGALARSFHITISDLMVGL